VFCKAVDEPLSKSQCGTVEVYPFVFGWVRHFYYTHYGGYKMKKLISLLLVLVMVLGLVACGAKAPEA